MDANQTIFSCPFVVRESSRRNKVLIGRNAEIAEKVALDPDTGPDGPHLFNVRARQTGISLFKESFFAAFFRLNFIGAS
jgi:hypothetical protein